MSGGGNGSTPYGSQPTYGASTGGTMSSGNFDPSNPFGGPLSSGSTAQPWSAFGAAKANPTPAPNMPSTGGNTPSGNFDPNNPFPGMDWSSVQQYLQQPYQPYMQPQQYQQPQQSYTPPNPPSPNQQAQDAANWQAQHMQDLQNGVQTQGGGYSGNATMDPSTSASPFGAAKSGLPPGYQPGPNGTIQFTPSAYPTWLYGPTAGAFGGVTPPAGTPQSYGYFPGTQTWGPQPSGNKF